MLAQDKLLFPFNALNNVGEIGNRLGRTMPHLDPYGIQERAIKATDLTDFGDPHYVTGLETLMNSTKEDGLNYLGRLMIEALSFEYAKTRLEWVEMMKRQPGSFATELLPPLIITGLPRSGTTLMHRMLATDPANQAIPLWRLMKPFPPLDDRKDNRYQIALRNQKIMDRVRPSLARKHEISIDLPEECLIVQGMSFNSAVFYSSAPVYTYVEWLEATDRYIAYEEYASMLQWYQSQDERRLVMKSPSHISVLSELVAAVPNALIVQTHRNPVVVASSLNSLMHSLHSNLMKPYRPEKMIEVSLHLLESAIERSESAKDKLNLNVCNVLYEDLVSDPIGVARKIYTHFGLRWTDVFEQNLTEYMVNNPQGKLGQHKYGSNDFGISDMQLRERFTNYIEQYDL